VLTGIAFVALGLIIAVVLASAASAVVVGLGLLRIPIGRELPDEATFRVVARASVPRGGQHRAVEPFHLPRRRHRRDGGVWADEPDDEWGDVLTREVDVDRAASTAGAQ
jgi:hypothetical protein